MDLELQSFPHLAGSTAHSTSRTYEMDAALALAKRAGLAACRKGCASVLKTHSSKEMVLGGLNSRYRYLRVSASQKDCILSSLVGGTTPTSTTPE